MDGALKMHFGLHKPDEEETAAIERLEEVLAPYRMVDCSKGVAMDVVRFAIHNDIDPEPFSRATSVYPETLTTGERRPAYPKELLDTEHVRQLYSFAKGILETVQQQYDPKALRDRTRNAPRDQLSVDVLDDDEY